MLVLSRKKGEDILVGDHIVVTCLGLDNFGSHKIGIYAPKEVSIVRREIAHKFDNKGNRLEIE